MALRRRHTMSLWAQRNLRMPHNQPLTGMERTLRFMHPRWDTFRNWPGMKAAILGKRRVEQIARSRRGISVWWRVEAEQAPFIRSRCGRRGQACQQMAHETCRTWLWLRLQDMTKRSTAQAWRERLARSTRNRKSWG